MHPTFEVPAAVVTYVASVIQTNGRDLDGAVNRLLAHASLNGVPLSMETSERPFVIWCARRSRRT